MLLASIGMFISTFIGTISGHSVIVLACVAGLWGFLYGLLVALDAGAAWPWLQSVITMLVASGYPEILTHGAVRASLILCGGVLQTLSLILLDYFGRIEPSELKLPTDLTAAAFVPAAHVVKQNLKASSEVFQYGLRLAVTLAITAGVAGYLLLPN